VIHDGIMDLQTYKIDSRWVSGGVSSAHSGALTYGKYLVRFRMDAGAGVAGILLLVPSASHWPPEVDFAENGGDETLRSYMTATLHYGPEDHLVQETVHADFTQWHTVGLEWLPGSLTFSLDGDVWATMTGSNVPSEAMEFAIQAQAGTCGVPHAPCPDETTPPQVNLQMDWAAAYAPT